MRVLAVQQCCSRRDARTSASRRRGEAEATYSTPWTMVKSAMVGWEEVIVPAGKFRGMKVHRDEVTDPRAGLVVHRLLRYKLN